MDNVNNEKATEYINVKVTPSFKKTWVNYCKEQDRPQSKQLIRILLKEMERDGVNFSGVKTDW